MRQSSGDQAGNIARTAVFAAGWPESVPATSVDRQCGSSQQAVHAVAGCDSRVLRHRSGRRGGVDEPGSDGLGQADGSPFPDSVLNRFGVKGFNQGIGAEMIAQKWASPERNWTSSPGIAPKAAAAAESGAFEGQLAKFDGVLEADEGIRRDTSLEKLGAPTVFREDG